MATTSSRRPRWRIHALAIFAIALATMAGYVAWRDARPWQAIEGQTLTWRFLLRGHLAPSPDIAILAIDDRTVQSLGRWPVPRAALARAVRALQSGGAGVVAFDLLLVDLEEPTVGGLPGAGDRDLIESVRRMEDIVLPFAFVFDDTAEQTSAAAIADSAFHVTRGRSTHSGADRPTPTGILAPFPALRAHSGTAHVNAILDRDGDLRFLNPAIGFDGQVYPALPVEAARRFLGISPSDVALLMDEGIRLGGVSIRTDAGMRMPVNYYGPRESFETISLSALLQDEVPPGHFRDRLVLIGATATGIGDSFATPFDRQMPGVEYFATAIDNILTQRYLKRADRTVLVDLGATLAISLMAGTVLFVANASMAVLIGGAVLLIWPAVAALALVLGTWWLNVTFPVAGGALVLAYIAVVRGARERSLRRRTELERGNLAQFLPPALASELAGPSRPEFEERTQPATIVFVDLRGFTRLTEDLGTEKSTDLLRAFHRRIEAAVSRHGGVLDKFLGDGAMAVFGLPEPRLEDTSSALASARDLVRDTADWSAERLQQDPDAAPLEIGVGLHYGSTLIARLGGARQHQLTATGDTVNVASRLQELTRDLGVNIVASDSLIEGVRAQGRSDLLAGFEPLPRRTLRGRRADIGIWVWSKEENGPKRT